MEQKNGRKKFTIKMKDPPKPPEDFEQKNWETALQGVNVVLSASTGTTSAAASLPFSFSCERVCSAVRSLCDSGKSYKLYLKLKEIFSAHVAEQISKTVRVSDVDPRECLTSLSMCWDKFTCAASEIGSLFMFLDRGFVLQETLERSIKGLGVKVFGDFLLAQEGIMDAALAGFLAAVADERSGFMADRKVLSSFTEVTCAFQQYFSVLEPAFLRESGQFFSAEAEGLVHREKVSPAFFFQAAATRISAERERVRAYLDPRTRQKIDECVQLKFIRPFISLVLDGGLKHMVSENQIQDIRRAFAICCLKHVQGADYLRGRFLDYIKSVGGEYVSVRDHHETMIQSLIQLKDKCDQLISACFGGSPLYKLSLREGFEAVMKLKLNKVADLLCRHLDLYLREGAAKVTLAEAEEQVVQGMSLFAFLPAKDIFEAQFSKQFAKRLIGHKCASLDLERIVIAKIKVECGPSTPSKLEGMIKDMDHSKELVGEFRESVQDSLMLEQGGKEVTPDFTVNVLTSGFWPSYPDLAPNVPNWMHQQRDSFERFYRNKNKGRRLKWVPTLSTCTVKARFGKLAKELFVSCIQGLILLLFNDAGNGEVEWSYEDVASRLGVDKSEPELICALLSLSGGAVKILRRKSGATNAAIVPSEMFEVNTTFTHKLTKIRVAQVQLRDPQEDEEQAVEKVMHDRTYVIDAVIVRFMKSRRRVPFPELIQGVTTMLKFPVEVADLKKRIDVLMERDYMKRDDKDITILEYVA